MPDKVLNTGYCLLDGLRTEQRKLRIVAILERMSVRVCQALVISSKPRIREPSPDLQESGCDLEGGR